MAGDSVVEPLITDLIKTLNDSSFNCDTKAQHIISNIVSCFKIEQNVSEYELALSLLFRPKNSLIHFIEKAAGNKFFKSSVKDALQCIYEPIFYKCKDLISPYVVPIKDVCYKCLLEKNSSADIKVKAYQVITAIISKMVKAPPEADLKVEELVNFLYNIELSTMNNSTSQNVVQGIFELYGAIAEHYPDVCADSNKNTPNIGSVIRRILIELKTQMQTTIDVKTHRITGCMVALSGILVHFTCGYDEDPDKSQQIYTYIKKACDKQYRHSRKCFQRAALDLFGRHMPQFWHWALIDHKYWLILLSSWAAENNSNDKQAGIKCLQKFHEHALKYLETPSEDPAYTELMGTLWNEYKAIFNNSMSSNSELSLAIKGVGSLASSGSQFSPDFVSVIFTTVLHWAQNNFNRESTDSSSRQMAECVQSLSHMCRGLGFVGSYHLAALLRLVKLTVEFFPQLAQGDIPFTVHSLICAVCNMALCQPPITDHFLYPLVYQGIIQSCSHNLLEEADIHTEATGGMKVITFQNYLPLWKGLFNIKYESKTMIPGVTKDLRMKLSKKLYDCLLRALLEILEKLDVRYTKLQSEPVEFMSNPETSLQGSNPQDHRILCNLVNICKDLMENLDSTALTKWLPELVPLLLRRSTSFPLVSAFYKLLASIFCLADSTNYFQDESEETQSLGKHIVRFMEDVMFHCQQYKNDLQASCLIAVVSVPVQLIRPLLAGVPTIVKTLMQLGQSYLSLAHKGVDALERWQRGLPPDELKPILQVVLPSFDPYLRSSGILVDTEEEEMRLSKKQEQRFKYVAESSELSRLQERMLRLLSQLDSATCLNMLREQAPAVAWSTQPVLTFILPFLNKRPNVCLDSILPRVVELALSSSDRQTKAAACEVLHACVLLLTGTSVTKEATHGKYLVSLQHRLLPAALSLGCGADLVAQQLFQPLVLQLAHWYSSPRMLKSPQAEAFLEILWNGVTDNGDPSLRDLCALSFKEFVSWSIRQTNDIYLENSPANIKAVVRRIKTYCEHPVLSKRIGAALVFNQLSQLLLPENTLVDQFWLELTFYLVKNLEKPGCHNHPVLAALDICQHGFLKHAVLFQQVSKKRKVPRDLNSGVIKDVLQWLLLQCGSITSACALKCRQIVESLLCCVPGLFTLADLSEMDGVDMVEVCEGGGDCSPLLEGDKQRLKGSMNCYNWAFQNNMIHPLSLSHSQSKLITCIIHFIEEIDLANLQQDDIDVISTIFELFSQLKEKITCLPTKIWSNKFWKLISFCVFSLREGPPGLFEKLCDLLKAMQEIKHAGWLQDLYEELSAQAKLDCTSCLDKLVHACHDLGSVDSLYIRGLDILQRSGHLLSVSKDSPWEGNSLLTGIYSCLFSDDNVPLHPDSTVLCYVKELISFAIHLKADVNVTVSSLLDTTPVRDTQTSATITKGEHLQGLLEDAVFKHLLDDSPVSVSTLLRTPSLRAIQVTLQLVLLCKYSKKRDNSEQNLAEHVSVAVTSHWGSLESWAEDVVIKKALLVELLKATVQMFPPSLAVGCLGRDPRNYKVSFWILKQLESEPLDQLAELISLLPCAILHGEPDTKLRSTLRNVQINKFPVSCDELKLGSAERNTFVAVYKSLLRAMVDSGSLGILHIISSAAADPKHACADQITPALQQFMKRHREERQVEALQEMFAKFLDECIVETIIGIVERFMMPMLLEASRPAVIRFYTERIQTIINFLENSPTINDQEWMVKKILARKIGAIQLTEPLFNRLDKKDLEAADNPIVRQAKVPKDKLLPNYFATFLNDLRQKTVSGSEEVQHLARKMQCCGYNALMTFLCNTNQSVTMDKVMQMFNVLLFSERRFKVWQKLVPSQPKYTFPIEFDDYPRMKKAMVQIRGLVKSNESASTSYLPSQSLFNSSLHEDITLFDFSMYRVRDEDRLNQVLNEDQRLASVTLDLEMDCLNNHECMATLCGVVKYLNDTFPAVVGLNGMVAVLPDWMGSLRSSLAASDQPDNCRAFIVKLIVNCQSYFKLAAEYFLGPILQTILDDCLGTGLNYLIHDIVRMLCDWSTLYKPISSQEQALASEFLRRLVRHTPNERTAVFKYNVEVVKCIVTAWETFESLPYQELLDLLSQAPEPGHLLADVFLSHNILPFNSTGKQSYYKSLLGNLNSSNQRLYKTCAVVIGKIFKILSDGGSHPLADEDKAFFTQVQEAICLEDNRQGSTAPKYLEHFIYCLHSIQKNYSAIVNKFVTQCISQLMRMSSSFQVMLLEALTSALDSDFHSDAFSLLRSEIPTLLTNHSYPDTQLATLKLIDKLMPSLTVVQMSELLPSVKRFLTHKRRDCRGTVYNIAKWMYNTYVGSSDATTVSLYKEARIFLLAGLADTDQQLQEDIFSFINDQLPRSENERLVEILSKLYSPDHEDTFLATVIKLLLQICELEPEFKENIFTDPLSSCAFEKYNVSGSWRTQHAAFVPMFADTLTSQMTSASLGSLSDISNQIRATQTLSSSSLLISVSNSNEEELSLYSFGGASTSGTSLSQSYKQGYGFGVDFLSPIDAADGKKLPEEKLMRMRFLRDKQKLSRKCAERNIVKAAHQKKQQSEKMKQREGQVTLRRNYRKGDLPDIEIPRSEFIKSLQSLANRDQLIARQLLVAVCHVIKVEAFALSSALDNILQTTTSCHPVLIASVLELSLLYKEQCKTPSSIIAEVSKKSQQMSLGALLVEAKLSGSCEPRPAKRVRNNYLSPEHQDWTHLAEIYRSMEEKDIVQGLFEEKIAGACAQSVRSALLSEDKNHWKAALKQYDDCINKDNSIDNFLDEARFKCFANLSQWRELNETLKIKKLKNNLDTVWDTDWNSEHSLSWLFLSEIIRCQESSVLHLAEDFSTALRRWMDDSSRSSYIKERFGEYLSMVFVVTDNFQRGKLTCEHSLQKFLLCWQQLDSMSYSLRVHHLLCLGSLMDLHLFLQLPPSSLSQGGDKVKKLLNQWLQSSPSSSDSLVAWETRAAYRYIFATKLEQKANTESLKKKLKQFQLEVQLKTADCAFEQKNVVVMRKYLNKIHEKQLPGAIKRRRQLAMSRAELLRACVEPDISAKMSRTLSVFDRIQKLRRNENMGLDLHLHTADFYSTLLSAFNASPSIMNTLSQTDRERLNHHLNGSDEDISAQLVAKVVVSLEDAVKSSPNVSLADSYLRLARFCHQIEDSLYHEKLIESLLRAMKHGSSEARRLFPILLQLPLLSHQQVFKSESEQVAEWMFLGWVSQLLANLDSEWGCVLAPLVLRMAKAYPVALQFPFLLSQDMNNDSATSDTVNKLKDLLKLSNVTETLVRALSCVCQPHLCLIYHIDKLRSALSQDEEQISKAYAQMTLEAYPAEENTLVKGVAFNIVEKFKNQIEGLQGKFMMKMLSPKEYSKRLLKIREDVHMESTSTEINNERAKLTQLAFFSPWLMDDYVGGVEVPGQYTGEERPLTDHHLIISRFDRHVEPQISLRAPIKITILGNDGKKHGYLVKFGEDLRQDQRLQQLFTLMSHLLRASTTGHRRLSVDTYTVSPLNSRLGLIQWVDHTTALKDFMLTSEELKTNFDLTNKSYDKWFKSRCNTSDPSPFYNSIKKDESVSVLQKAQKKIPSHMLRDAVWKLAASPEAFIHLRAEMLASYGCMSICHWLLGVGDRHLSNILVRQDCGRLLGIDFGHAFGTATQMLAVPELVPCRLTSQLINLASPFNTTGLLKESMVHTLQVIRENRRVLLAAMTVFIQEPSVDWLKAARRHQELNNVPLSNNAQWYPEERISESRRKLEGAHPRSIMEKELEGGHRNRPHYQKLLQFLREAYIDVDMPADNLSSRQQVECLIAHATNEFLLSISFSGWMPWV